VALEGLLVPQLLREAETLESPAVRLLSAIISAVLPDLTAPKEPLVLAERAGLVRLALCLA
jgi:hypothetical protein